MNFEKAEQVKVLHPKQILHDLTHVNTSTTSEQFGELIKNISALLISRNTVVNKLEDSQLLIEDILHLLEPLTDEGFIKIRIENIIKDDLNIPFIFITSEEEEETVANILNKVRTQSTQSPVEIEVPIVHSHIDTTALSGVYSSLDTYIQNKDNFLDSLISGRGIIDMKSQISVMIIALYLLHYLGKKPPMMILTADEENACRGSEVIIEQMYPTKGVLDLEPSHPNLLANEIWPSSQLKYYLGERKPQTVDKFINREDEVILRILKDCAISIAGYYYPAPRYDVHVSAERHRFAVSIVDTLNYNALPDFVHDFKVGITSEVLNYFHITASHIGPHPSMQSDLSPKTKRIMERTLTRRKPLKPIKTKDVLTKTQEETDIPGRSSILHNFATMGSLTFANYGVDDIGIIGPRELGYGRHSKLELLRLGDDVDLLMNLVEMLCEGEEIFIEG